MSQQKLIYSGMIFTTPNSGCAGKGILRYGATLIQLEGKILQDANTVESYKIEEKGFIVCMVTKVSSM
jgi:hypothetical protein